MARPIIHSMKIFLVQHGHAVSKDVDPGRSLSADGENDVRYVATHMNDRHIIPSCIYHSGKMRAHQTAEIFNDILAVSEDVIAIDGINPGDDAAAYANKQVPELQDASMIVGHLPFMANLVSLLVIGRQEPHIVAYTPGSVVCMVNDKASNWYVGWMLRPDLVATK